MGPVDIGIGHDNQLVVVGLVNIEVLAKAGTQGRKEGANFFVSQYPVQGCLFDVQNLPPNRQDGLGQPRPPLLGRTTGGVPLDDE